MSSASLPDRHLLNLSKTSFKVSVMPPEGSIYWHAKIVELQCRLVGNAKPDELLENDVITYTIYSVVWEAD